MQTDIFEQNFALNEGLPVGNYQLKTSELRHFVEFLSNADKSAITKCEKKGFIVEGGESGTVVNVGKGSSGIDTERHRRDGLPDTDCRTVNCCL